MAHGLLAVNDAVVQTMLSSLPFDEMRAADGALRPHYRAFADWLERTPPDRIAQKRGEAERIFHRVGITFAVYGEQAGTERLIPFDSCRASFPPTNGHGSKRASCSACAR